MRAHKVDLKFTDLVTGNADIAQFANAGCDGVGDFVVRDQVVDHGAGGIHSLTCIWSQQDRTSLERDFADGFQGEVVSVDV